MCARKSQQLLQSWMVTSWFCSRMFRYTSISQFRIINYTLINIHDTSKSSYETQFNIIENLEFDNFFNFVIQQFLFIFSIFLNFIPFQNFFREKFKNQLSVFKIDSWDSETLQIKLNNVLLKEFKFDVSQGSNQCGSGDYPDLSVDLSYEFFEQNEDITIAITDNLDQPTFDESWGFRDFSIEIFIPCVSLHSECNYQGELFKICIGDNTILQKDLPFPIKSITMASGTFVTLHDPFYHSGESQIYAQSQSCLDDFRFPKFFFEE